MLSKNIRKTGTLYKKRDKTHAAFFNAQDETSDTAPIACTDIENSTADLDVAMEREEDMNDEEESDQETSSIHDTDKMDFSNMSLEDCIKFYALSTNQSHIAINLLSNILSANLGRSLPKSARTLLKTRRNNDDVHNIPGGQLWYYGVAQNIRNYYRSSVPNITALSINISIDGLPLYKSSRTQFWPILMDIVELENAPVMTVGIFCGQSKPTNVQDYLRKLVDELKDILINGILINSAQIKINLRAIIADAPARAFIKGCAYFNATHGCMKCTCEGEFSPLSNTTTFKSINAPLRTDKEFRAGAYPDHVKVISPLLEIPDIDIIRDVIISESLHLFYLGILKRLLFGWRDGKLGKCYKWSGMQCDSVSEHLVGIELPSEIHRRFRRLDELKNWKGTELASFLHYAGLVVLKVLPSEAYEHFLLLFCAVTMLSSNEFKKNWHVAGKMLETFVIQYGQIYGEQYLTSNVHNLLHVLDEVRHFGPLPSLSAFRYENKLQFIKKSLRGTNRPLAQAANRNIELQNFFTIANNTVPSYPLTKNNKTNDLLITSGFLLQNNNRNGWFLTLDKQIIRYQSFVFDSETEIRIEGFVLPGNTDYFQYPIKSNHLYVFRGNRRDLRKKSSMFKLSDIKCKLAAVTTNDGDEHVFVPLLHTLR